MFFFLGYSVTFLRLAFPQTLALPPPPLMGNTTVTESLGHVTVRGVHPQLITSASTSSLATHVCREPCRNYTSVLIGGGLCNCSSLRLKLALYYPQIRIQGSAPCLLNYNFQPLLYCRRPFSSPSYIYNKFTMFIITLLCIGFSSGAWEIQLRRGAWLCLLLGVGT